MVRSMWRTLQRCEIEGRAGDIALNALATDRTHPTADLDRVSKSLPANLELQQQLLQRHKDAADSGCAHQKHRQHASRVTCDEQARNELCGCSAYASGWIASTTQSSSAKRDSMKRVQALARTVRGLRSS